MDSKTLRAFLDKIADGSLKPDQAARKLSRERMAEMPCGVTLDTGRGNRTGLHETVFGPGKSPEQLVQCVRGLSQAGLPALATRLTTAQGRMLTEAFPNGAFHEYAGLFSLGRVLKLEEPWPLAGEVMVVCAGTSDLPVALEALGSAQFFGLDCGLVADVGVAGLHRLSPHLEALSSARAVVAVAGMDGALPGVLGGMTPAPVVAVPTSTGYGAAMGGLSAMFTMLNACSPGVAVVNIDNGFGAAAMAARIIGARKP